VVAKVVEPMIGNLAWAPLPAFEEVEVLDRFNGVPTLGVFGQPGDRVLFWRVTGYVPRRNELSVWMYVPLGGTDEQRLEAASGSEFLEGLIFNAAVSRPVTVGVCHAYRLVLEYQWDLPPGLSSNHVVKGLAGFLSSALAKTMDENVGQRRKAAAKASAVVSELAAI
jgi:hypothetical protein